MIGKVSGASLTVMFLLIGGSLLRSEPTAIEVGDPGPAAGRLDANIDFLAARATEDPYGATNQAWLGMLYLQRARESANPADVERGEAAARESLRLRSMNNSAAYAILASSLIEQHRFGEALLAAQRLETEDPENLSYRAMVAEIQMELGDYPEAAKRFTSLESATNDLDVAPRLAHWLELTGNTKKARILLYGIREQALATVGIPEEQMAWYHLRIGDFERRHGHLRDAEKALQAGLAIWPDDYRLIDASTRLYAARREWGRALEYGERLLSLSPTPEAFFLMSDISAASGDPSAAEEYRAGAVAMLSGPLDNVHRVASMSLLDNGLRVGEILAMAENQLDVRHDIYGEDLYAWALYRAGEYDKASKVSQAALKLGTPDSMLLYHAGMIEKALGHERSARELLERCLDIDPAFHPLAADSARTALDELRPQWFRLGKRLFLH